MHFLFPEAHLLLARWTGIGIPGYYTGPAVPVVSILQYLGVERPLRRVPGELRRPAAIGAMRLVQT